MDLAEPAPLPVVALLRPAVVAPGTSVAERSAPSRPTSTLRELARASLSEAGRTIAAPGAGLDPLWYSTLRTCQAQIRLLRPIVDPAWNEHARAMLRVANTLVTDLETLGHLLDVTRDSPRTHARLYDRSIRAGLTLYELTRSGSWTELTQAMTTGGWPVRQGRFELDEPASEFLPGQLLPLYKKLARLDGTLHDDWSLRLAGKTAHRLAVGFAMLARSAVAPAAESTRGCQRILDELAAPLLHSRAMELAQTLGLSPAVAEPLRVETGPWTDAISRHLQGENLIRTPGSAKPVEGAGGVVWRRVDGRIEVILVSRLRQRDWSLPKGKQAIDETPVECALRETFEETGLACEPGLELLDIGYRDRAGRKKHVRFWEMRPVDGEMRADHEISEVRWVELQEAIRSVTRAREQLVLASLTVAMESVA